MLTPRRPLRVAVLCSHRAPGLRGLVEAAAAGRSAFTVVCCVSSEEACAEQAWLSEWNVAWRAHPLREFYRRAAPQASLRDRAIRARYDEATAAVLAPFHPDLILLASYLYTLTAPMLAAYPGRTVNIHGSDLTLTDAAGAPRYIGLRSVRDAIFAGERETRATAHVVTERLDAGPPLLRSWPFPVSGLAADALRWGATDMLKAYAFAHQEWMLRAAWGPLLARTARLFAAGRVAVADESVTIDGEPGPRDLSASGMLLAAPRGRGAPASAWGTGP
jgi:phosphoribosylglycinamide formyltransferase-1